MDALHTRLLETLHSHQLSTSRARIAVFDALLHQEPQTMHDLVTKLSSQINRASVYRVIDVYEKLGIVQRLQIGWKYKLELTDQFHDHHHHISCQSCGVVIVVNGDSHIEKDILELANKYNFILQSHLLEIRGLCQSCNKLVV